MNLSIFGSRDTVQANAPPVPMLPPGSGTFQVGAHAYLAQKGAGMKVQAEHVAALEAQGWITPLQENIRVALQAAPVPPEVIAAERERRRQDSFQPIPTGAPMVRVLPPLDGPNRSMTVEGRPYSGMDPKPQDVPDIDARVLCCNGWLFLAALGTLADRPARGGPRRIEEGRELIYDGSAWRDVATGAKA